MRAIAIWVCCCAYLNCAGWILSAIHELNTAGYTIALLAGLGAVLIWRRKTATPILPRFDRRKFRRRFWKPFPAIFLSVAVLVFIGGAIYPPNNYDALSYRLPRMLNWLAAGHWVWIPTLNSRMNFSACGWEWVAMPFFALLHSDRGLFLINATGFLLMPGLLFSVFRHLGVARRVAWTWMWILPLAYGYATQSGGIGNDFAGALFGLISIYYGLRARRSQNVKDIWLAALAAALMVGAKTSNLPLLLPCLVAVWPALPRLRGRLPASIAVACAAVLISAPTMALNQIHTGSWTGDPKNVQQMQVKSPPVAFLGNSLLLLQQSFMPPLLPGARNVHDWMDKKLPASWRQMLKEQFPKYEGATLNELPQEESAGLGLGVALLLLAAIGAAIRGIIGKRSLPKTSAVALAAWISVLFYMFKLGNEAVARLMLPYYPLAIVLVLALPGQNSLLRSRAWKILAALAALSVLPVIILSPSRPMFPAVPISARLAQSHPDSATAQRLATVYSTYAHRNDLLAPLRDALPDDARKIGFLAGDNDSDYSLWRPFGRRQVVYLQSDDQKSVNVPGDVEWVVVKRKVWPEFSRQPLEEWAAERHAEIVLSVPIVTLVSWGEESWCLLRVPKP